MLGFRTPRQQNLFRGRREERTIRKTAIKKRSNVSKEYIEISILKPPKSFDQKSKISNSRIKKFVEDFFSTPSLPLLLRCPYSFVAPTPSLPLLLRCPYSFVAPTPSLLLLLRCHYFFVASILSLPLLLRCFYFFVASILSLFLLFRCLYSFVVFIFSLLLLFRCFCFFVSLIILRVRRFNVDRFITFSIFSDFISTCNSYERNEKTVSITIACEIT